MIRDRPLDIIDPRTGKRVGVARLKDDGTFDSETVHDSVWNETRYTDKNKEREVNNVHFPKWVEML